MSVVLAACTGGLVLTGLLCLLRLVRGPTVPDRMIALDTLLFLVAAGIALDAARTREGTYLGLLVVVSLLGFVGTVTTARFVERRGS